MITFEDLKNGKIKPEFGNMEHIRVVRAFEKKQAGEGKKMFKVTFELSGTCSYDVEAVDEAEAKNISQGYGIDCDDWDINDINVEELK